MRTKRSRSPYLITLMGLVLTGTHGASGQSVDSTSILKREYCHVADSTLSAHPTHDEYVTAFGNLNACADRGATELARLWSAPPADPAFRGALVGATCQLSDLRITKVLEPIVVSSANPQRLRFDALAAFVGQFNPRLRVHIETPQQYRHSGLQLVDWGVVTSGVRNGTEPLDAAGKAEILQTLRHLSSNDPDPVMRSVAARLVNGLSQGAYSH